MSHCQQALSNVSKISNRARIFFLFQNLSDTFQTIAMTLSIFMTEETLWPAYLDEGLQVAQSWA